MKPFIVNMIAAAGLMAAGSASATDMPPLAKKHNCTACHTIEKKLVGPAWRDVARAYNVVGATGSAVNPSTYKVSNKVSDILAKNQAKNAEDWLVHKDSHGGSGNWGTMPMPANDPDGAKESEIRELIKFILGLENK